MSPLELHRLWSLDGRKMALWSEPSRRRLRRETQAISQVLAPHIPRSCTHVRGHGGVKGALRQIQRRMPKARFVARFDIAAYYTSMRHDVFAAQEAREKSLAKARSELSARANKARSPERLCRLERAASVGTALVDKGAERGGCLSAALNPSGGFDVTPILGRDPETPAICARAFVLGGWRCCYGQ